MSIAGALKRYSREFIMKIHPDRHCGFPEVQEANSAALNIITPLFQTEDTLQTPAPPHPLRFYLKHSDYPGEVQQKANIQRTNSHLLISYLLRQESARSALGLFSLAGIDVDWKLSDNQDKSVDPTGSPLLDECKYIVIDSELTKEDVLAVKEILRTHPNIQISPEAPLLPTMKLLFLLQSTLIHLTYSRNPPPIFIFQSPNSHFNYSTSTGVYQIPSDPRLFPGKHLFHPRKSHI